MASNLTIEAPNFEKIGKEAGQFTQDAIALLWAAFNDTRKTERMDFRQATDILAPKVLTLAAAASVNNLDLEGCSVLSFTGASAQNLTGARAPDTGKTRILIVFVGGAGTITVKHLATSESGNQFSNSTGADVALATGHGRIYVYLAGKWREVA